jgi:hypothetical protein
MNRFLPTLLTAGLILLGGAATASANVPMKIVAEGGSNVFAQDHEIFSANETFTKNIAGTTFGTLLAGSGSFSKKITACAGDEVRTELIVDGYRFSGSDTATVTAHVDMYEGASCATTDFDGQSKFVSVTLKPGETKKVYVQTWSTEVGGDFGSATVTFHALPL